jgi:hypothetical protein
MTKRSFGPGALMFGWKMKSVNAKTVLLQSSLPKMPFPESALTKRKENIICKRAHFPE